jgi:hypothetical protein
MRIVGFLVISLEISRLEEVEMKLQNSGKHSMEFLDIPLHGTILQMFERISSSRFECGKEYNHVLVSRGLNRANIHARTIEEHGDRNFQFIHY